MSSWRSIVCMNIKKFNNNFSKEQALVLHIHRTKQCWTKFYPWPCTHPPTHPYYNYTHYIHNFIYIYTKQLQKQQQPLSHYISPMFQTPPPLSLRWRNVHGSSGLTVQLCGNTNWEWLWPLPPLVVDTGWSSCRHHQGQGSVSASPWTQTDQKNSSTVPLHKANQKMHQQTLVKFWKEEKNIHSHLQLHCHRQLSLSWNHHHKGVEKVKQIFPLLSCLPQCLCVPLPAQPHQTIFLVSSRHVYCNRTCGPFLILGPGGGWRLPRRDIHTGINHCL